MKCEFQNNLNKKLQERNVSEIDKIDQIYKKLKESLEDVADEICGNEQSKRKQNWMNSSILNKMEERRNYKNMHTEEGEKKYKELKHDIQKLCREAEDKYFNDKCEEIELLDKTHSQLLYKKLRTCSLEEILLCR